LTFQVRFSQASREDLEILYAFLAYQDPEAGRRAIEVIDQAWEILESFPFSCRKATASNPFIRELVIPFGHAGYVALFEIEDEQTVTVLAVRHQREEDFH
jgi:plasmid stabilization system protein ParE